MSERTKKFSDELDRLIRVGNELCMAMEYDCHRKAFIDQVYENFKGDEEQSEKYLRKLPNFYLAYQKWYSEAQSVVKQVLPDRVSDFISHYEQQKVRKEITYQNYTVRDYLKGLRITRAGGTQVIADGSAAIPEFMQQLNIVMAAKETLESTLLDLRAILQADLFDTEIQTAAALAKGGYLRASGAICGVVIEKHLLHVCDMHGVAVRKKYPGISDLSQRLKDAGITTVPQWRFIQHLADIRNICDHAKGREPTKEEIDDLVVGSEKVLKTVF